MKYSIGVALGAKFIQVGLVDKNGRLLARKKVESQSKRDLKEIVADAADLINQLLDDEELDIRNAKSIGVACPGVPDEEGSKIVKTYVMNLYNAPIKEEFKVYFDNPIYVENDARCIALAESVAGAAEGLEHSVTINIGTGISGGIIIDGKIYSGFEGAGAVLGHMVIDKNGKKCTCGRTGCFETVCSAKALIEATREVALNDPESAIMKICENDLSSVNEITAYKAMLLGEYTDNMSVALTNLANILMPEVIVLSGGITALGENLLKPIREKMKETVFSRETTLPMLKLSEMGSASVLVGAGMLETYKRQ